MATPFDPREKKIFDPAHDVYRYTPRSLQPIFSPKSVAVIGAVVLFTAGYAVKALIVGTSPLSAAQAAARPQVDAEELRQRYRALQGEYQKKRAEGYDLRQVNELVLQLREALEKKKFRVRDLNWISGSAVPAGQWCICMWSVWTRWVQIW